MIRSMTGFGRADFAVEGSAFGVEVRSVNHRYLDVGLRLPRGFAAFEPELRALVGERLSRGKVDLQVRGASDAPPAETVAFDLAAADRYLQAAGELGKRTGTAGALDVGTLLSLPGVARLVERSLPAEALRCGLLEGIGLALGALVAMREQEGRTLESELRGRLERIAALVEAIAGRADDVQRALRERFAKRAAQLREELGGLDEARLHQEVAWALDRLDATEEIVRLRGHVEHFGSILAGGGPVGRRLDFLLQEMVREANTLGAKASDAPVAHQVVELKTELERAREQVQNVE